MVLVILVETYICRVERLFQSQTQSSYALTNDELNLLKPAKASYCTGIITPHYFSINKPQCERVVCEEYKLLENRLDKLEKVIRLYFITVLGIFYNDRFAKRENCFVCGGSVVYEFFYGIF